MKIVIFYFTGTGNTRYIAENLELSLNRKGMEAKSMSIVGIEKMQIDEEINNNDIVFIAYPIYGSDMPENMKRFIHSMPDGNDKKLGVICSQMLFSGDGSSIMHRFLRKKGYDQIWSYQINMPNNLCIKGSPFKQYDDYDVIEQRYLAGARAKVGKICDAVIGDKRRVGDNTIFHKAMALMQRPFYKSMGKKSFSHKLNVDISLCNKCEKCIDNCPNNVIMMDDEQVKFTQQDKCTVCLRCMNYCPKSAITFGGNVKQPLYKGPTKDMFLKIFNGR